ncbi:MAG: hypothetical protein WBG70_08215 [Spirulinaceae cyanobacterium]
MTNSINKKALLIISVALIVIFFLAPILWQLLTSFKVNEDISAMPNVYLPNRFTLGHYQELFSRRPFIYYILNSAFVSITSTLLCLALDVGWAKENFFVIKQVGKICPPLLKVSFIGDRSSESVAYIWSISIFSTSHASISKKPESSPAVIELL